MLLTLLKLMVLSCAAEGAPSYCWEENRLCGLEAIVSVTVNAAAETGCLNDLV